VYHGPVTKTDTHQITCGSCKGSHETPADVKACYAIHFTHDGFRRTERERADMRERTYGDPAQTPGPSWKNGEPEAEAPLEPGLYDGVYTIDLTDRHYTFKVYPNASDSKFAPGATVVSYLFGRDNEESYKGCAFIKEGQLQIWRKFRDQPGSARLIAALEQLFANPKAENVVAAIHCRRCHHLLTVPASVYNGLGPECAKKGLK
jgi:hypothetical protein